MKGRFIVKFLKNNFKLIIGFIVGVILASSITVYAYSYFARDISYTKPGTETAISVETALNDLYSKANESNISINLVNEQPFSVYSGNSKTFDIKTLTERYANLTNNSFFYTTDFYASGNGIENNVSLSFDYNRENGILTVSSNGVFSPGSKFAYYKNIVFYYFY